MMECFKALSALILGLLMVSIYCQNNTSDDHGSGEQEHNESGRPLIFVWIEKPPYATSPGNGSWNKDVREIIVDALLTEGDCLTDDYDRRDLKVDSEFGMIELLRQNKAHFAFPIFEQTPNRQYNAFPFFKLDDYPGTEYITSVFKSWPLFAVTLVLTAIAGVLMWALDTYWNSEEFSRQFMRGSWDGFWWSFISMTTVGYGDKSPKSIPARIFSIIWILIGLIIMAIFMANVTSALTAVSLDVGLSSLTGLKVAVLGNGTEYQHAVHEGAHPEEYENVDDMVKAVTSEKVDGIMLDRYTSSFHQEMGQLKSLIIVKKFEFSREVGVLFSRDKKDIADCLNEDYRSDILRKVQDSTKTYKLTKRKTTKKFNLFDESSPFVKKFLYISLGVLGALILIGTVWEIGLRKKNKVKENALKVCTVGSQKGETSKESATISDDVEAAKIFLGKADEYLHKLEAKVAKLQINY